MGKGKINKVQNKGYSEAGASHRKKALKGFTAQSGSPREDIDENNYTLRQRGRMIYMGAPIATSAIRTNRTNVVGIGLKLNCTINRDVLGMTAEQAEAWERKTEAEFDMWAKNKRACDAIGVNDFYALQQLALQSWLVSGDVFCLFKRYETNWRYPYSLRLHLIEADRISTPGSSGFKSLNGIHGYDLSIYGQAKNGNKIYDGVEVDSQGLVQAYYIRSTYPGQFTKEKTEWTRIPAVGEKTGLPNILQVMDSERPDQYRGITYLAQVIEPLLQVRRYTESEITAAIIESFFTAFVKTEANPAAVPFNEVGSEQEQVSHDSNEYEMGPGQINFMKPGESVEFGQPTRPNSAFAEFVEAMAKQIGSALEIPKDLLLKEFNSSYSASRAALMEAWKSFKMRREWFTNDFCRPIYEAWLCEAVALGRIDAPGFFVDPLIREAYLASEWIGPSQGQLDPVKEITAEILACEHGFSTHEQSTVKLNGGKWDRNVDQLKRENESLDRAKTTVNINFNEKEENEDAKDE